MSHRKMLDWKTCFAIGFLAAFSLLILQCGGEDSSVSGSGVECETHEDCPVGYSCIMSEGVCGKDANATECDPSKGDSDCPQGYICSADSESETGNGKCVPAPDDGSGGAPGGGGTSNSCEKSEDCPPGQDCINFVCVPLSGSDGDIDDSKPPQPDGDDSSPIPDDDEPVAADEDEDPAADGDTPEGGDEDMSPDGDQGDCYPCDRSSECPGDKVCGPGPEASHGCCIERCTEDSCEFGICNPNNGLCECCYDICAPNQCCNYHVDFWYCGTCCVPPCPEGQACQSGRCVKVECNCEPGQKCGPETCWICEDEQEDNGEAEFSNFSCLSANSPCIEGVDVCCSGTCLMGTCL